MSCIIERMVVMSNKYFEKFFINYGTYKHANNYTQFFNVINTIRKPIMIFILRKNGVLE